MTARSQVLLWCAALGFVAAAPVSVLANEAASPPVVAPEVTQDDPLTLSDQRAEQLFGALREILDEAAEARQAQREEEEAPLSDFMRRQLGLDSDARVKELLGSAFEMVTDTPIVGLQEEIEGAKGEIAELRAQIAELKERRIAAPDDAGWEGWLGLAEDRAALDGAVDELEGRIAAQERRISEAKRKFAEAMAAAGAPLPPDQVDLLLESVTGGDLVRLAAAYEAVRGVSDQLRKLMDESGEDLTYAKRYYGMHTTLLALLLEAQGRFLEQIDDSYLPRLSDIEGDLRAAAKETETLLRDEPTRAQREILRANRESQEVAKDALQLYRDVLKRQRSEVAAAHERTEKELRVADNTLRTVDASFQLRQVMESAAQSFETLQSLESPGFERAFRNERLRKEFKELTDKLGPSS